MASLRAKLEGGFFLFYETRIKQLQRPAKPYFDPILLKKLFKQRLKINRQ